MRWAGRTLETLTCQLERAAAEQIQRIDDMGGALIAAIEAGYPQREIEQRAYEYQRSIEDQGRIIVESTTFACRTRRP